jgi:CelD/BcsL family acetyltransferase involved in cellulose biosynthesis
MPLLHRKVAGFIDAGVMPANHWSPSGDLLMDPDVDANQVADMLVAAMGELPWQLVWLEDVAIDSVRWKALFDALARAAVATDYQDQFEIGRIEIEHDWPAYQRRWSRKHRQQMARQARRLAENGEVRLRRLVRLAPEEVEPWMRRGFEIEDQSWKGAADTSVLRTPGMFDFFIRQAQQLTRWGQLEIAFLECGERPVAFAYGHSAKGVYHSHKIGYDPAYAAYSPGQLLRYSMLKQLYDQLEFRAVDYIAPSDAHRKWKPTFYRVGRLIVAPRSLVGRAVLHAYKRGWSKHRRPRNQIGG